MENKLDVEHLVLSSILSAYPTPKVEQKLSVEANLYKDLDLRFSEVHYLGLFIEKEIQPDKPSGYFLTDEQIKACQTVKDIINTIESILL